MSEAPRLGIVVPVLNERANVASLVERVQVSLHDWNWELLFVDDDSTDGTADEVRHIALGNPRVRLVLRVSQPGLANSCIQGMLSSCADFLCVMDGDGQHDPAYIAPMMDLLRREQADIVSAARVLKHGNPGLDAGRHLLSGAGNFLARFAIGREAQDLLSGFFVVRRAAFLSVVRGLSDSGFKLLFDILATGKRLRHVELPFEFKPRHSGRSKLSAIVVMQFALLLAEKFTRGWLPARMLSFLAVGSAGLLVHMLVLFALLGQAAGFALAQAVAALTAMTFNFAFNNALTFNDRRFRGRSLVGGWLGYLLVCSVGLAANVSVASWAFQQLQWAAVLAALAGIAMDVMWKFVISDRVLWRRRTRR